MSERLKNRLRQLNTERLEEMLRMDSLSKSGSNEDVISSVLEVLEERAAESEETAIDVDAMWKAFCEDYLPGAENGSLYLEGEASEQSDDSTAPTVHRKAPKHTPLRVLARAACAVAAVVALFFSSVGIAEAAGYDAWDTVASWTEDIFADGGRCGNLIVSDPTSHEPGGTGSYASLQDALDVYGITEPIALTWIPKEYSAEYVVARTTAGGAEISAVYMSDEKVSEKNVRKGIAVDITLDVSDTAEHGAQLYAGGSKVYKRGGVEHYIVSSGDGKVASWRQGGCACLISGNGLSTADMKRIIRSIYE